MGRLRRVLKPSRYRTEPVCPYFGRCGGCQFQHIAYEQQLTIKERQVKEIFSRLGNFKTPPILEIIPSPCQFHYRGKADYHFLTGSDGKLLSLGFMEGSSNLVLDIKRCEIVEESINRSCQAWREALQQGERKVLRERQTIWSTLEDGGVWVVPDDDRNPSFIDRIVRGRHLVVPYDGFFQINTILVESLVETVMALADLKGGETVLDGYCGSGLFSIFLSPQAGRIIGVEINDAAVQCARENIRQMGYENTLFFQGDIGSMMERKFVKKGLKADTVILDPPRSGCDRGVLEAVKAIKAKKIIYVSCNPATQARDMRFLVDAGFSLECLQPIDMFPQTSHIEVIGLLKAI